MRIHRHSPQLFAGALLVGLACCTPSAAQSRVQIVRVTGEWEPVLLTGIRSDGQLLGPDIESELTLNDVTSIETGSKVIAGKSPSRVVWLAAGGKLLASAVTLNGETFTIQTTFGSWRLPAEAVRAIALAPQDESRLFLQAMENRSPEMDQVVAAGTDSQQVIEGLLEALTADRVQLNYQGQSRTISLDKVVGVVTADLGLNLPPGAQAMVTLVDGSQMSGVLQQLLDGQLQMKFVGAGEVEVPWYAVARVTIKSDRLAYLSDLQPVEVDERPLATAPFQWRRDQSVEGNPLMMKVDGRARVFERGLGTHANSRLVFANEGGFDRLAAVVGIDEETQGRGRCLVSVLGDNRQLWSGEVSGGGPPLEVAVDISGIRRVALVVNAGPDLDMGDHVDWANARFLKTRD